MDLELAKGRILKWGHVIFDAKIWMHRLFISSSRSFMYILWRCRVLALNVFAKIMKRSCVFCYSSWISFNPTSHLKQKHNNNNYTNNNNFLRQPDTICRGIIISDVFTGNFQVNFYSEWGKRYLIPSCFLNVLSIFPHFLKD